MTRRGFTKPEIDGGIMFFILNIPKYKTKIMLNCIRVYFASCIQRS